MPEFASRAADTHVVDISRDIEFASKLERGST
jgi:hypothetical protein